jgi:hypothetical protein
VLKVQLLVSPKESTSMQKLPLTKHNARVAAYVLQRSQLIDDDRGWLKEDALHISVDLNVLLPAGKPSPLPADSNEVHVPAPSIQADMTKLLDTGER